MKISRVAVLLTLAGLAALARAGPINTDWDHGVDFSKFKSYAWTDGTSIKDELMQDRAVSAIDEQLQAKGLKKVDSGADLSVALHAATHEGIQLDSTGFGYGGFGTTTTDVESIPVGSLIVDLIEVGDNKLVWRGMANNVFIPSNPQKATKKLEGAIDKMFINYPPKQ